MLRRAKENTDTSPYVIVAGPQGTGKTFSVVSAMLAMTEPFRKRALKSTSPQLEEPDQTRIKPDGTEVPIRKRSAKNDPSYEKGKKKAKSCASSILSELDNKPNSFSKIIVVVPDKQMGAKTETLPGDRMAKMAPKIAAIRELIAQAIMQARKQAGLKYDESLCFSIADEILPMIEFVTMGELSSRSPTNALIILDEAQFHTPAQIRLAIGRPAEGSILVILADPYQTMNRFGATGNSVAIVMRRVYGKEPFLTLMTTKPIRNGPKLTYGIRI
jgi:predicted ribonuclease YlaK